MSNNSIRIQKHFSDLGIASRRKTEEWIAKGYVLLNGTVVTEPGTRFDPQKDEVTLDPKANEAETYHYLLFNKPKDIVTVNAQGGETEIKDIIELPKGVVPVGRLDKDSFGLILLTNDGVVARRLMEPTFEHEKEYEVWLYNTISETALQKLRQGMVILGEKTKQAKVKKLSGYRLSIILKEGKNRQIRRMCKAVGFPIRKLQRVRIENLFLGNLPVGEARPLKKAELQELFQRLKIKKA